MASVIDISNMVIKLIYDIGNYTNDLINTIYPYLIFFILGVMLIIFIFANQKESRFPGLENSKDTKGWILNYNPIIDTPEYKRMKENKNYEAATKKELLPQNKIKIQYKPRLSKSDRVVLGDIERKKENLIRMKEQFLQGASEEEYNRRLQEFDARTKEINDKAYLDGYVHSVLNPVLEASTTPQRLPRVTVPPKEYKSYIHSNAWKKRSTEYKESKKGICELCNMDVGIANLKTHHKSYPDSLKEGDNPSHWVATCRECHNKSHDKKSYLTNGKYAPTKKEAGQDKIMNNRWRVIK